MCPKLPELLSWNGPTVQVCRFMLARASIKPFVSRIHIRQPSPKTAKKIFEHSSAGPLVSRGIAVVFFCGGFLNFGDTYLLFLCSQAVHACFKNKRQCSKLFVSLFRHFSLPEYSILMRFNRPSDTTVFVQCFYFEANISITSS